MISVDNSQKDAAAFKGAPPTGAEVDALFANLEAQLAREKGPRAWLRSRSSRLRFAMVALMLGGLMLLEAEQSGRLQVLLGSWPIVVGQLLLIAHGASLWLRSGTWSRSDRVLAVGAFLVLAPFWVAFAVGSVGSAPARESLFQGLECFPHGVLYSAPLAFLLALLDRSDAPSTRSLILRGALVGVVANLLLSFHCPSLDILHLFSGHAGVGVGWVVGSLVWQRARSLTTRTG